MTTAIYPGSFDPITLGHIDIVERISSLYDRVIVLISESPDKKGLFTVKERLQLCQKTLSHLKNVTVESHTGLTVEFVKARKAKVIVRGLRSSSDYEYELTMAQMNKKLAPQIETMLVYANPELSFISSRGVKEIARHKGSLKGLVAPQIEKALKSKLGG